MRSILTAAIAIALAALLWPSLRLNDGSVRAGTAVRLEIPGLVQNADLILEGRVLASRTLDNLGRIETEFLVEVERTFEGEDLPHRLIRIPGGVLPDGRALVLSGMPHFKEGERMLLFLSKKSRSGIRMPVGLAQGKLTVVRRKDGSKALLQDATGVSLVTRRGDELGSGTRGVLEYAEVKAQIQAALVKKRATEER